MSVSSERRIRRGMGRRVVDPSVDLLSPSLSRNPSDRSSKRTLAFPQ